VRRAIVLVAFVALAAAPAVSYVLLTDLDDGTAPRWPGARAVIHHDPETIRGAYVTALARALGTWSRVSGSDFRFEHGGKSRAADPRALGNGSSDCYFDAKLDRAAYAVTIMNYNGTGVVLERDVAFNANPKYSDQVRWTTNPTSVAGGPVDFETVALHELGHVAGLGHPTPDQANVPSVMNSIYMFKDPAFPNRRLFKDDEAGVRALYPQGSADGPDLAVTEVTFIESGPEIEVRFAIRNDGDRSSGAFAATAHLTDATSPGLLDPLIGTTRTPLSLAVGETTSAAIDGEIPAGTPPGEYRVGVILDPGGTIADVDRANNGATAAGTVNVTRPPIGIAVGETVTGGIGPFGTDRATLSLLAGTKVTFRSRMDGGTAALSLRRGDVEVVLSKVGRKAKVTYVVLADGEYSLELLSGYSGLTHYRLKTKAKTLRGKAAGTLAPGGEWTFPVPALAGAEVKVVVRGRNGFVPRAAIDGVDAVEKANGRGTKVTLGPFSAPSTGELTLRVTGDAAGSFSVSWRARTPKDPATRVR